MWSLRTIETLLELGEVGQVDVGVIVEIRILRAGGRHRPIRPVETVLELGEIGQIDVAIAVEVGID
jgi:hypothetical protein